MKNSTDNNHFSTRLGGSASWSQSGGKNVKMKTSWSFFEAQASTGKEGFRLYTTKGKNMAEDDEFEVVVMGTGTKKIGKFQYYL